MKTRAVRLYGEKDLRLEEFELPQLKDGEILIKIICDSVCMSTYKTALQGAKHLRVPDDVAENPIIIGHEFCGEVVGTSKGLKSDYQIGDKVIMPPRAFLSWRNADRRLQLWRAWRRFHICHCLQPYYRKRIFNKA